jgi:hypothetical protein
VIADSRQRDGAVRFVTPNHALAAGGVTVKGRVEIPVMCGYAPAPEEVEGSGLLGLAIVALILVAAASMLLLGVKGRMNRKHPKTGVRARLGF